ncbi:MAG: Hsp20/alpha crystallin family protein [Cytophagaceae bacterium]|nr:Hsp20/alpha crystallin family protein [Cytophagaceae bacterium]
MTHAKSGEVKEFIPKTFTDIIDNLFNDTLGNVSNKVLKFLPGADIVEGEKNYEIHLAIPGMNKEDIRIEFQDGKLTISGERKFEKEEQGKKYYTVETQYGAFQRSFYLPDNINLEAIDASYEAGILKLNIPKDEKKIAKTTIQVK